MIREWPGVCEHFFVGSYNKLCQLSLIKCSENFPFSFLPGVGKVAEKEMKFRFNAETSKGSHIQILDEMGF